MSSRKKTPNSVPNREKPAISEGAAEPLAFDEIVKRALEFCYSLPDSFLSYKNQISELQNRLSKGRLHLAVLGQFNRGKSTFINALLGIRVLPTSVLPLTSVPTIIEYGNESRCTVRFLDDKPDLIIEDSIHNIEETLRRYVAEENNPKNRDQVKDVTITCTSPLLHNGTILIDTPGFGSTHEHNTKTTLDLLAECDAALFLLSAEPPMTQVEKEFLAQVKTSIPRIFFILNKVDLLTESEAVDIDRFIKDILQNQLGYSSDLPLYHTCALKGEEAKTTSTEDPDWNASGLENVKQEILDFMVREKYFALSEALHEKFEDALKGIRNQLESQLANTRAPISELEKELKTITQAIQELTLDMENEQKKAASEKVAALEYVNASITQTRDTFSADLLESLDKILKNAFFPSEASTIASSVLPKQANDYSYRILTKTLDSTNKKLRRALISFQRTFQSQTSEFRKLIDSEKHPSVAPEEIMEAIEIPLIHKETIFEDKPFPMPQPRILDIFKSKQSRFDEVRSFYSPICEEMIGNQLEKMLQFSSEQTENSWNKFHDAVTESYMSLINALKDLYAGKRQLLDTTREEHKPEIQFTEKELGSLGEIEKLVNNKY